MLPIITVSSAYFKMLTLGYAAVIESVYMEKSSGDKTVPWGVPVLVIIRLEISESNLVYCTRSVRKLEIHDVMLGSMCDNFSTSFRYTYRIECRRKIKK